MSLRHGNKKARASRDYILRMDCARMNLVWLEFACRFGAMGSLREFMSGEGKARASRGYILCMDCIRMHFVVLKLARSSGAVGKLA